MEKCPGCGYICDFFHEHHIVPTSIGGLDESSNIIRICEDCHAKIHMRKSVNLSSLIKAGIAKVRSEGRETWGPKGIEKDIIEKIIKLRSSGISFRKIAKELGVSSTTVFRVIERMSL